jgi:hypothetical protein
LVDSRAPPRSHAAEDSIPDRHTGVGSIRFLVKGTVGVTLSNLTVDGANNLLDACDPQIALFETSTAAFNRVFRDGV